jgi:soluble lytic murein transglycosylase-like protein
MRRTLLALSILTASTLAPASPVDASAARRCPQYESMIARYSGWNVTRMSRIAWRESRCDARAHNPRNRDNSYGLLQLNTKVTPRMNLWGELQRRCGLVAREQLFDPATNIACAHKLFLAYGMKPWAL